MINSKAMIAQIKKIFRSYCHLGKKRGRLNNRGFTWVELIVVMVIMGIISAVVASRFTVDDTELVARTDTIKAHLRYAQLRSLNTDAVWYLQFTVGTYELYKSGDATPKLLPGAESPTITLPSGITVTYGAFAVVAFNAWGKPCTDSAGQVLQILDRTLTVIGGSDSRAIVITENTGFIQ